MNCVCPHLPLLLAAAVAVLCHAAAAAPATGPATLEKPSLKIDETVLYRIPGDVKVADTVASPDARHVACVEMRTGATRRTFDVCIDSTPGPQFHWIVGRSLSFSPDGRRFTYQTQEEGPISVVLDSVNDALGQAIGPAGAVGAKPEGITLGKGYWLAGRVVFSPDGRRFAYAAQTEKRRYVLVADGRETGPYDGLDDAQILFSPAGDHLAYRARLNVAGGTAGDPGAAADVAGKQFFVLDGKPGPAFDGASEAVFSANGARFGYHAKQGKYEFYVIDRKLGPGYDMVGGLTFSPDGRRCAYVGGQGGKQMLVVDGKAFKPFDGFAEIAFSPDGRRVAASVQTAGKWGVVVDGAASAQYEGVAALRFSPDSQRLAFVAGAGWRQWIVADNRDGPTFDGVTAVTFSPNSRHLAYLATDRLGKSVILDGQRIGPGESIAFSPDSRHLARTILYPDGHWALAVDGAEADARYDGFPVGSQIVFDSLDTFRIIGGRGNELMRIEVHIR